MIERHNVIAALAVAAVLLASAVLRPAAPPSFDTEYGRIAAAERELLNRFKAVSAQFKAGELPDADSRT